MFYKHKILSCMAITLLPVLSIASQEGTLPSTMPLRQIEMPLKISPTDLLLLHQDRVLKNKAASAYSAKAFNPIQEKTPSLYPINNGTWLEFLELEESGPVATEVPAFSGDSFRNHYYLVPDQLYREQPSEHLLLTSVEPVEHCWLSVAPCRFSECVKDLQLPERLSLECQAYQPEAGDEPLWVKIDLPEADYEKSYSLYFAYEIETATRAVYLVIISIANGSITIKRIKISSAQFSLLQKLLQGNSVNTPLIKVDSGYLVMSRSKGNGLSLDLVYDLDEAPENTALTFHINDRGELLVYSPCVGSSRSPCFTKTACWQKALRCLLPCLYSQEGSLPDTNPFQDIAYELHMQTDDIREAAELIRHYFHSREGKDALAFLVLSVLDQKNLMDKANAFIGDLLQNKKSHLLLAKDTEHSWEETFDAINIALNMYVYTHQESSIGRNRLATFFMKKLDFHRDRSNFKNELTAQRVRQFLEKYEREAGTLTGNSL